MWGLSHRRDARRGKSKTPIAGPWEFVDCVPSSSDIIRQEVKLSGRLLATYGADCDHWSTCGEGQRRGPAAPVARFGHLRRGADKEQSDRATRNEQCVVAGTTCAGPEGTMDRTALRKPEPKLESGLRQSDRNRLMRTRMSGGVGTEGAIPSATRLGRMVEVSRIWKDRLWRYLAAALQIVGGAAIMVHKITRQCATRTSRCLPTVGEPFDKQPPSEPVRVWIHVL